MPVLNLSELNVVLGVLGAFMVLYGIISVKIKQAWYLGEALPAVFFGVILGPIAAKFIESEKWGSAEAGQTSAITLGLARVMIGVQLVIAGYQLPAKYGLTRWKEMALCLLPIMTVMVVYYRMHHDPILSQAVGKGPFGDKYVARPLREVISAEAGANDGFGFPFLMLATYLIQHAENPPAAAGAVAEGLSGVDAGHALMARAGEVGRLGGGVGVAMANWFLETWLYTIALSIIYGAVLGYGSCKAVKFALKSKWIDEESYVLFPTALGLFTIGTCGAISTDDLLACFVAGMALNWDGNYLRETERRHDEVNSCVDVLLNFGGFMYIGAILPWGDFHSPEVTGITWGRLIGLGLLVLVFRRLPAIFAFYKLMPDVCTNWKEALFMGYFGPIGAGAVFYVEHARHLFPYEGEGDEEETNLVRAMGPVVYFLVLFSIIVHGLSIPALNIFYHYTGKAPIREDAVEMRRLSVRVATPPNAIAGDKDTFIAYNRFSRHVDPSAVNLPSTRSMDDHSDDEDLGKGRKPGIAFV
ncbi:Na(+) H(+) antiporter [Fusarium pseudoanthophilum]|uniref:Na(+) H(+) antiporter n=1 Tax=Fusarium pseudoanthophilum TaxID=48495 RepID=A0A8H5KWU0_9HYPO|nr:Na(+) H(+) antiporter [Fusarium pseudoanthophilum]